MKVSNIISSIVFVVFFTIANSKAQNKEALIKTTEYFSDNLKRRDLYLDSNLKIKREDYFGQTVMDKLYKLGSIEYTNADKRKKVTLFNEHSHIVLYVDFEKGIYNDYTNDIYLKFKGDFNFDGIQKGNKIVVNYKDGKRNGRLIQTDSAVNGSKTMIYQGYDPRYLQFDIIKFYNQPITISTYKLFNGIELNYKDGELNGLQKMYYSNSKLKFFAEYNNFKLDKFSSFTKEGNLISRIITENGITKKNQLINGTISSDDKYRLFYLRKLSQVGSIVFENYQGYSRRYHLNNENEVIEAKFDRKTKLDFDNSKEKFKRVEFSEDASRHLQYLLGIPKFKIVTFDLETSDDNLINSIYLNNYDSISKPQTFNVKLYKYLINYNCEDCKYANLPLPYIATDENHLLSSMERGNEEEQNENDNRVENDFLKSYLLKGYGIKSYLSNGLDY